MALAYIDARDVQDRLDAVCGVDGWQCRDVPMHDKKTVCEVGVRIGNEWIWKADGAGDSDVEAEKGALSDAFKRAAVRWGIGRYLYDLESPWVALEPAGQSYKIAAGEYARREDGYSVHTNTAEGYFGVFKKGMRGVYQHCAEKHLHRYLAEFDFRFNNRVALGVHDGERATLAVKGAAGKRLTYRQPH